MKQKEITVLMVAPGEQPKVVTLKDDLDSWQKAVRLTGETMLSRVSETELLSKSPWGRFGEEPLKFGED